MRVSRPILTCTRFYPYLDKTQMLAFGSRPPRQPVRPTKNDGPDPFDILRLIQLLDQQQALQAEELANKLLKKTYGDSKSQIFLKNALAACLVKQQQYDKALPWYEEALALSQQHFGPRHLETAALHQRIGQVYIKLAKNAHHQHHNQNQATQYFAQGKAHLNKALKIFIHCLPANAAQIGLTVSDLVSMFDIGYDPKDKRTRRFFKQLIETKWEPCPELEADIRYLKERLQYPPS